MPDQVFGNNYVVLETLGEGSFGVVYLCHDRRLDRRVALKMLKPECTDEKELRRFMAEARRLASLNDENVVQVFDMDESVPYMVMEYFPGRTLREIRRNPPLPLEKSLRIMIQIAQGLKAIHDVQVVHRDLSTNNIMVDDSDRAKILDLGLARDLEQISITATHGIAGTLKYMAPEVIAGGKATFASDIFSFGVILYELVTSEHPFEAEHFMSTLYNIVNRPHLPMSQIIPNLPPALGTLVDQCLLKDPQERLADLPLIAERLQSVLTLPELSTLSQSLSSGAVLPHKVPRFKNPYLNRVMLKRPSDFYGRKQEVKRIYSRLNATPPGSVSVVGDRKIGKSSLLNYVYMKRNRQQYLEEHDSTIMVYVDLQQQKNMSLETFVNIVLGIANLELRGRLDVTECARDLSGIRDLVERLHASNLRLVLLMDEFEAITTNPNFDLEFFSFLRYLANHYDVAYVTSSARDLQQLCHTKEIRDSPFFNIFTPLPLSVFRLEEACELIRVPSEAAGQPLRPYEKQILDMAGLFPFFLQIACSHSLELIEEDPKRKLDFAEIHRRFYEEARLHYRFMWQTFDEHERSAILRVAEGRRIPDALWHVCEELLRKHYLESQDGETHLFSTCFKEFVESEVSSRRRRRPWLRRLFQPGDGT